VEQLVWSTRAQGSKHETASLQDLHLSNNSIQTISNDAFDDLNQLVSIDLSLNQYQYIYVEWFQNKTKLSKVQKSFYQIPTYLFVDVVYLPDLIQYWEEIICFVSFFFITSWPLCGFTCP